MKQKLLLNSYNIFLIVHDTNSWFTSSFVFITYKLGLFKSFIGSRDHVFISMYYHYLFMARMLFNYTLHILDANNEFDRSFVFHKNVFFILMYIIFLNKYSVVYLICYIFWSIKMSGVNRMYCVDLLNGYKII